MSRPFRGSREKVGFLSSRCSGKVPQLALRGGSPSFSQDAAVFLSSYNGPVRCEGPLGIPPQLLLGRWSSSGVEAGTSGFLFRTNLDLGVPLDAPGSQASSHVEPCNSTLLSSRKRSVRLPVRLTIGIYGFLSRRHRVVTPAIFF